METTAAPTHNINRLSRSRSDRYLGGVAGGLGDYFGIDPVVFRILFVALTLAGASGVALYIIAWLLVPAEGSEQSILGRRFASGGGVRTIRNVFLAAAATLVALMMLATVALGLVAASSDVAFRGGIGDRSWAPSSVQEMHRTYRLAAGDINLDLSAVAVPEGSTRVDASVVAGHVVVRVPRDAAVIVDAHTGAGRVTVFGNRNEGTNAGRSVSAESTRRLVVTAKAGVGDVEVVRA
ncbi:MAG: PspC domain-containing protein [Actinomycetota bacterium]|nr:PspC domain-containing protein [Actinomycetota bacterium]